MYSPYLHLFCIIKLLTKYMAQTINQMPIPDLYREVNHLTDHGIEGYHVENKYADPLEMMRSRDLASGSTSKLKKYETKRGNYLDDYSNLHKAVPGPGKYKIKSEWPQKQKNMHPVHDRKTHIQQIMQKAKKQKSPAPGHYNTFKTDKQIAAEKKVLASKKIPVNDRLTYLDHIQYQSQLTPGVGSYNPRKRVYTEGSKIKTKPEDWRKKHETLRKKKLPKLPDMRTYNPLPAAYNLFQSPVKKETNKNLLGKVERFKTQASGSGLGPNKYSSIQQWRGKDVKKQRHGFQSFSKGISKSVYYN